MKKRWQILETRPQSAAENMEIDIQLLKGLRRGDDPILRFYNWSKASGTYGYFLNPSRYLDLAEVESRAISLARRPTGGGVSFHIGDLTFSLLMPSTCAHFSRIPLENYHFVNGAVKRAIEEVGTSENPALLSEEVRFSTDESCRHFCMAKPTQYDVMLQGRKVAGAAQRQKKEGYLHQGSISIAPPDFNFLGDLFLQKNRVVQAMQRHASSLLRAPYTRGDVEEVRARLKESLIFHLTH